MRIEIFVEEESIKTLLIEVIPRICNQTSWRLDENIFIRSFEGKSHLRKELPRKAKVYANYYESVYLIVFQDQDSNNCQDLKNQLVNIINESGLRQFKVRIVCRELECWYLGDMDAIEQIIPSFKSANYQNRAKFRLPEKLNGKDELRKLIKLYSATEFAKNIGQHLSINNVNKAPSFNLAIQTLKEIICT
ncbi:MAG: DUF4276 family protein, partial [Saprospiraceae bacterium]|nr:DUF4276 family protein [Saprospiraceae bacterium]